jgi:putative oligomerization/nucleic acid binding protein
LISGRGWRAGAVAVSSIAALLAAVAAVASADSQSLASSLTGDPVQNIGAKSSFTSLSASQITSLETEIARFDLGRIWIAVVSPRNDSSLSNLADPVFGDLPAGTLIVVAEDPNNPNTTNWWVGASWQSSEAAQTQLNDVIQGYKKGQGSLFDDLRLEVRSFARADAAAGHPPLGSSGNGSASPAPSDQGSGFPFGLAVTGAIVLLLGGMGGGRYLRQSARSSHRRGEESADAHEQAHKDFIKLGEAITALDIDSSMPNASSAGSDEYRHAIGCYEAAERRLKHADDAYQFQKAVWAIKAGLRHVHAADQLFNPPHDPNKEIDDLARLAELHRSGALTDDEFAKQKAKLLN